MLFILLGVISIILIGIYLKTRSDIYIMSAIVIGIFAAITLIVIPAATADTAVKLKAFYDTNPHEFIAQKLQDSSLEKLSYVTQINNYNAMLAAHIYWQTNWMFYPIHTLVDPNLKLIVIK